jgi:hypothetical protein
MLRELCENEKAELDGTPPLYLGLPPELNNNLESGRSSAIRATLSMSDPPQYLYALLLKKLESSSAISDALLLDNMSRGLTSNISRIKGSLDEGVGNSQSKTRILV